MLQLVVETLQLAMAELQLKTRLGQLLGLLLRVEQLLERLLQVRRRLGQVLGQLLRAQGPGAIGEERLGGWLLRD